MSSVFMAAALALAPTLQTSMDTGPAAQIEDNSFLIEEAYNQEQGVVQHISALSWSSGAHSWTYSFTQEWPLGSQRDQLSYTLPIIHAAGTRLGDVAINYRRQVVGTSGPISFAPRLTILAPTGRVAAGAGAGGVGFQVNLPLSAVVAPWLVTNGNAGVTVTPSAANGAGDHATATAVNLGASAIWRLMPTIHLMLEIAWSRTEAVAGSGVTSAEQQLFLSPGVRWAYNFDNGLQIVPGIAFPFGVGPSRGDDLVFVYLSFEHPFRHVRS